MGRTGTSGTSAARPSTYTTQASAPRPNIIPRVPPIGEDTLGMISLSPYEARTAAAVFERLFPADEHGPGATEIGVLTYVDRALAGAYRDKAEIYRFGLAALDLSARRRYGAPFAGCAPQQ